MLIFKFAPHAQCTLYIHCTYLHLSLLVCREISRKLLVFYRPREQCDSANDLVTQCIYMNMAVGNWCTYICSVDSFDVEVSFDGLCDSGGMVLD